MIRTWVDCLHTKEKLGSDLPAFTAKVSALTCLSCTISCPNAPMIMEKIIPMLEDEVDTSRLTKKRYGKYFSEICPLNPTKDCWANRRFCKHNHNCKNRRFTGKFKSIRWRRRKMYGIKFKKSTEIKLYEKEELKNLTTDIIKSIDKVYRITHALTTTIELVPNTDEGTEFKSNIKSVIEKYGQNVLVEDGGETKLKSWFEKADVGDSCFTIGGELTPRMKIVSKPISKFFEELKEGGSTKPEPKTPKKTAKTTSKKAVKEAVGDAIGEVLEEVTKIKRRKRKTKGSTK